MNKPSSSVPPSEPTASPIKGKRIRRNLKKFMWGPGNRASDKFWKKNAYGIIQSFVIVGVFFLIASLIASHFWKSLGLTRNVYYFFIFIGAGLAATLGTWRGRQSERQLREFKRQIEDSRSEREVARLERQVARFEKAIDMATDHTSIDRRVSGFQILNQIFYNWRKDFDHLVEENILILQSISTAPFWITERKNGEALRELYKNDRRYYSEGIGIKAGENLFEITSEHKVNSAALILWQEITNWRGEKWGGHITTCGICSPVVKKHSYYACVFFRIVLYDVIFLMVDDRGKVNISTPEQRANFISSCFVQVGMNNATLDHVNFSISHFFAINALEKKDKMDCKMSCKGTIFDSANLINCYFGETDFKDASFDNTNISGSDFSQAKNLTPEQFKTAFWIRPAKPEFPESFPDNFAVTLLPQPDPNKEWYK